MRSWLVPALKGIISLAFGILLLSSPSKSAVLLATYIGFFAVFSGLVALITAFVRKYKGHANPFWFVEGSFNIAIGLILFFYPEDSLRIAIILFGVLAFILGFLALSGWIAARKAGISPGILILTASVSFAVGVVLVFNPFESAELIVIIIGIYSLFYGFFSFLEAFRYFSFKPDSDT